MMIMMLMLVTMRPPPPSLPIDVFLQNRERKTKHIYTC